MAYMNAEQIARFWSHVPTHKSPDECWEWNAWRNVEGYGSFQSRLLVPKDIRAHRLAYALANQIEYPELLQDSVIRHACDNPPCCNPAHLVIGTQADNVADMIERERHVATKGEINGRALMTANEVLEMRALYATGGYSHRRLAEIFEVKKSQVGNILTRKSWKHI